jgi:hypothetical protein
MYSTIAADSARSKPSSSINGAAPSGCSALSSGGERRVTA